jgi:hypothetical protein
MENIDHDNVWHLQFWKFYHFFHTIIFLGAQIDELFVHNSLMNQYVDNCCKKNYNWNKKSLTMVQNKKH